MGEAKRKQEVLEAAQRDVLAWGQRKILLEMDLTEMIAMCGALQLALRHPAYAAKPSAESVRGIVMQLANQVPAEYPGIRALIGMGFHPKFDR